MKEHQLVNKKKRQTRPRDREWVKDLLPPCRISLEYLEIDIKYGYVHGQRRNGLTVIVIDVESRWVLIKNHCCQLVNVQTWTNIKFS
ncbi:MAG: hypothetical protein H6570_22215 [Lewinellaceae bacterium]|nr:hypothetical protein [Lewinellaceae bacterium]